MIKTKTLLATALASLLLSQAVIAQVYVRDADTIVVDSTPVRLNGVDAPELGTQSGRNAKRWMVNYLKGKAIECDLNGERTHDRQHVRILLCCWMPQCSHRKTFTVGKLLEVLGEDATFRDLMNRTRCSSCGRRPYELRQIWDHRPLDGLR